ncbi:MAG: hypothetical protein AABX53_01115 [Nanoarchaeota archaeon]
MAQTARTLVKAARFDHSLREAVRRSSHTIYRVGVNAGNVTKYMAYEGGREPFLLVVAQQRDIRVTTPPGYNLTFSVTSYSDRQNGALTEQFSQQTGVAFNIEPPSALVRLISGTDFMFPSFVRDPEAVRLLWEAVKI